jgi:hypothetical protein
MIILLAIVGYIAGAYLTFTWARNTYINIVFKRELDKSRRLTYFKEDEIRYTESALREAKRDFSASVPGIAPVATLIWPGYFIGLVFYHVCVRLPKFSMMQSKSERYVNTLKKNKAELESRQNEWKNALKVMKEAGIDTTELRKIKIE